MTPRPDGFWNEKTNLQPSHDYARERRIGWRFVAVGALLLLGMVLL